MSRVALYSFLFSFLASLIIAALRMAFPTFLLDLGAYSRNRDEYVSAHYTAVIWTVVLQVLIAFALVFLTDQYLAAGIPSKLNEKLPDRLQKVISTDIVQHGIWWDLFVVAVKKGEQKGKIAQLNIRLTDGSRVVGFFLTCTPYDDFEKAEIAIKRGSGPMLLLDTEDPLEQKSSKKLENDDVIWVRGEDISYIRVQYKKRISDAEALARRGLPVAPGSDVGKKNY